MRGRCRGERGAGLVEIVFVIPVFIAIVFGAIEFGAAWDNRLKIETAARAGARVGSALGNDRLADWNLLQSALSALQEVKLANVDYIVVYKAGTNGAIPTGCNSATPTSQNGKCNVYTGTQLATLTQAAFTGTSSCANNAPDRFWCPTSRQDIQHLGTDYLGVLIRANSPTVTEIFNSPIKLRASSVMRLEPA
jgi:hypothetical protein